MGRPPSAKWPSLRKHNADTTRSRDPSHNPTRDSRPRAGYVAGPVGGVEERDVTEGVVGGEPVMVVTGWSGVCRHKMSTLTRRSW